MSLSLLDWRRRVARMYADARAGSATDPEAAWQRWRAARDELFATHPDSPVAGREVFTALPYAPYNPDLRFETTLDTGVPPERLEVPTSDAQPVLLDRVGRVHLPVGDLDVWWVAAYGGGLFLPFGDATNGHSTYGGGRYLLDTVKGADLGGADGRLVVDFNYAYHPSCRYDPRWSCPLAPEGNRLTVGIEAGEQLG